MTNPAQEALKARLAELLAQQAPQSAADAQPEHHAETPMAESAALAEQHIEAPHAEPEHVETPVFALVTAPAEEVAASVEQAPAEEPVLALPPAEEPTAIDVVAAHPLEEPVIDLSPVAAAMAATAADFRVPRMELTEAAHEAPATRREQPRSHEELLPPEAKAEPVTVPAESAVDPAIAVMVPAATATAAVVAVAPRAPAAGFIARTVALMSLLLPYSLVALALRLVTARLFFLHGQAKIEGPSYVINSQDLVGWPLVNWVMTLPMTVKDQTYAAFAQMAHLPIPSWMAAPFVSYIEFILPICLMLGFATRFAALGFLIMTAVIAVFVAPETFWTTQVYWASILLVLMSRGPGVVSIDAIIRHFHRK